MPRLLSAAFLVLPVLLVAGTAQAQGVVSQRILSLPLAKTIAEAALAECKSRGFHTSVAVLDRAGQTLVILRDEMAGAETAEMARRKAYTARVFRMTSWDFQKRSMDPGYAAQRNAPEILALGGGVPIKIGEEIIGAVGSSGSSQMDDDVCAKAGVARVADQLK
ncbi:MAG: heme-binding protein [Bryobacteraceae bacterium]